MKQTTMNEMKKFVTPFCRMLTAFLLVFSILSPTSCVENPHPEINLEFKSDYSGVIAAIESAKLSMSEKLSLLEDAVKDQTASLEVKLGLVEAAVKAGFADADAQQKLLREAVESLSGTVEEKLSAVEAALKSQTTSFETKLGLIEAAVAAGFADAQSQRELLRQAVEALGGTLEEKLAALDTAVRSQTAGLEAKLGLIEAAVNAGFADVNAQQKLLREAVEALGGTVEEKLSALDTAVRSQTAALETKLGLIEAAVTNGFADQQAALELLKSSVESLKAEAAAADSTLATAVAAISETLDKISSSLSGDISAQLSAIFQAVAGRPDHTSALSAILAAVEKIWKEIDPLKGHEYVDLGLPSGLKWATMNVGATKPEDYGSYFAWGEISQKDNYEWGTYRYGNGDNNKVTKYCPIDKPSSWAGVGSPDNSFVLDAGDDAARASWGGAWRMPTRAEFEELLKNCDGVWTTQNGVKGYKFTASNGNSIFLPAAGRRYGTSIGGAGSYGYYWSSSLDTGYPDHAWRLYFLSGDAGTDSYLSRYYGQSVRPVAGEGVKVPATGVELKSALTLAVGGSAALVATVLPHDATERAVTWKSSNDNVAEVSPSGVVTAKKDGTATITVTTADGGRTATCEVTVTEYAFVDLGLPSGLLWATMNIGAAKPEDCGDYFAWGDTATLYKTLDPLTWKDGKDAGYVWTNCSFWTSGSTLNDVKFRKYCPSDKTAFWGVDGSPDNNLELDVEDDAARHNWGGTWRMPTKAEFEELVATRQDTQNYEWTWCNGTTVKYNNTTAVGWLIKRKSPETILFLPLTGRQDGTSPAYPSIGFYWSSSLHTDDPRNAWALDFYSGNASTGNYYRFRGFPVRPVTE